MALKGNNSSHQRDAAVYNWLARQFHWFIAALIFMSFALGWTMEGLELSKAKLSFYAWHKWLGLIILALVVLRLCWRFLTKAPEQSSPQVPAVFHIGAKIGHFLLYAVLIFLPLVGWLRSSSAGFQVVLFEVLPVPDLLEKDEALSKQLAEVHELLALLLAVLIAGHVGAVVLHHVFFKDPVLDKMKPHFLHKALVVLTLLGGMGFYLSYAVFSSSSDGKPRLEEKQQAPKKAASSQEVKRGESEAKPEGEAMSEDGAGGKDMWVVDKQASLLEFTATQKGAKTTGLFKNYRLKRLVFNPKELAKAVVEIEIDVTSISLSNLMAEQTLASSKWFDASEFPIASFHSKQFKALGGDVYEVRGDLQIKDITHPNIIKLTIKFIDDASEGSVVIEATGETSLSRLAYKVGQDEWASTDDLADDVGLKVHIRAVKKR